MTSPVYQQHVKRSILVGPMVSHMAVNPEDRLGEIFEPFFTTRKEGTGLGLYIARQLCEANQAELTVESRPGEGTRFRIRMALASGRANPSQDFDEFTAFQARETA